MSVEQTSRLQREAVSYLEQHTVITLATIGPNGLWAAAVFYASDRFTFYFLSAGHTRHARNLAVDNRVAGTIQENYIDWVSIKGIQLEGTARQVAGGEKEYAIDLFSRKYREMDLASDPLRSALAAVQWYCLKPDQLYLIDNSKGFGHRDGVDLVIQ